MKNMQNKRLLSDGGFSLVELLITMLISGIVTVAAVAFLSLGIRYYGNADDEATIQNESQIATMFLTELIQEANTFRVMDVSSHSEFGYAFEVTRPEIDPLTGENIRDSVTDEIINFSSVVALRGNQLWYIEGINAAGTDAEKLDALAGMGLEGAFLASKVQWITLDLSEAGDGLVKLTMNFQVNDRVYQDTAVISLRNKKRN